MHKQKVQSIIIRAKDIDGDEGTIIKDNGGGNNITAFSSSLKQSKRSPNSVAERSTASVGDFV